MNFLIRIDLNIFAIIIAVIILFSIDNRGKKCFLESQIFILIVVFNIIVLLLETAGWIIDGQLWRNAHNLNYLINIVFYILNPVPPMLWSLYVDAQIFNNRKRIKKLILFLSIPVMINCILSVMTLITGKMFYIDIQNIYHRGEWFFIMVIINYSYLVYAFINILIYRNRIEERNFLPLLFFSFPPLIGGLLQSMFYGLTLVWEGLTISLLIIFIQIQSRQINTDYLTNLYNRRQLDHYLQALIGNQIKGRTFAGIMIDIDDLKDINDQYGHAVGDDAIRETAELLKQCFGYKDFIARYAGDEFVIIVEEVQSVKEKINNIKKTVELFNKKNEKRYKLKLSLGYEVYVPERGISADEFLKQADKNMYYEKQKKKGDLYEE